MEQSKKEMVLVTGGSGFVGSYCIIQLLKEGYLVKTVCYGDVDHLIPGQTDHQLADVGRAANAIKACTKIVI